MRRIANFTPARAHLTKAKMKQNTVRCIDWSQVVCDLERVGLSLGDIAAGCGYRPATRTRPDDGGKAWASRLKNIPDTQPDFHGGALLIGLWVDRVQRPIADIPRAEYRYVRNAAGRITALPLVDRPAGEVLRVEVMPGEA